VLALPSGNFPPGSLPFFRLVPITSFSVPEFGGATELERRRARVSEGKS
jgi:hypothetical protein